MQDINIKLIDMDTKVSEQVVKNTDDSYTIFLNAKMSYEKMATAYIHALRHIYQNDFYKENANIIEIFAHQM